MKNVHPSREELTTDFTARQSRNRMSRSAALQTLREVRQPSGTAGPNSYQKDRGFSPSRWGLVSSCNPWDSS